MARKSSGDNAPKKTPPSANLSPPWKPGQSGNPAGRPKGARSKLGEDFIEALIKDFADGGVEAIRLMRAEKPNEYVRALVAILPKEVDATIAMPIGDMLDELDD